MFLDDTACNLASLNLLPFRAEGQVFDVEAYEHAVPAVDRRARNLGADGAVPVARKSPSSPTLPHARPRLRQYRRPADDLGHPYDSDEGRASAARSPRS
jgi:ribonucleoside-diphosphate reductase alpha chain